MTRGQTALELILILMLVVLIATIAIVMSTNMVSDVANAISKVTIIPK